MTAEENQVTPLIDTVRVKEPNSGTLQIRLQEERVAGDEEGSETSSETDWTSLICPQRP